MNKYAEHSKADEKIKTRTQSGKWRSDCLKKKRYKNLSMVESVIKKIKTEREVSLRHYFCRNCQGYHMTKTALRVS